jgi:hypothetical protein
LYNIDINCALDFGFYLGYKVIMTETISEEVSVGMNEYPKWVKWKGRTYKVEKVGLHHTYRRGKVLYHVFSVATKTLFMRLSFNTETLGWRLEEVEENGIQ